MQAKRRLIAVCLIGGLAVVGSIFFCIQTVILDAIVWGQPFGCRETQQLLV